MDRGRWRGLRRHPAAVSSRSSLAGSRSSLAGEPIGEVDAPRLVSEDLSVSGDDLAPVNGGDRHPADPLSLPERVVALSPVAVDPEGHLLFGVENGKVRIGAGRDDSLARVHAVLAGGVL